MDASVQLFREDVRLTACAVGEPSVTLIRNDAEFALLLADGAHEDSFTGRLHLDGVSHLQVAGLKWTWTDFDAVALDREDGLWLVQDLATGRCFRNPSRRPYCVLFIDDEDHQRLRACRAAGRSGPVFEFAQVRFGRLPGFASAANSLSTPDDYATAADDLPPSRYLSASSSQA